MKLPVILCVPARTRALTGCATDTGCRSSASATAACCRPAPGLSWQLVGRLRCLRGIDTLTALALIVEIGDFNRFRSAEEFMAFVGLVPSEHSSGEKRRQGSITKVGNSHLRRLLVEAAWHARRRPKVGYDLARRQRGQDAVVVERAWRCQQRLYQRWQRMAGRGKPQQKIVVACARELAGFVWAIATEQPLRTT
jgi:transposase